ncbi:MAG: hypothetical protein LBV26_03525 [Bacteroidales bacterium]|jgi:hypothetical protein|nr:hypothetical protein [Bacteroidales bacterium]
MKKQIYRYIAVVAILVSAVFASCKDNDETQDPVILLEEMHHIRHHNDTKDVFEYDKRNRITKCLTYYIGTTEVYYTNTITYKANGNLELLIESGETYITTFAKKGNKISYTDEINNTSGEMEVDSQGFPVKGTWERKGDNLGRGTSTFTWENGNLTQEKREYCVENDGKEYSYIETSTYTYDNKKSPFYNCATPKWFLMYWLGVAYCGENNLETAIYSRLPAHTLTAKNTYNDDGFLISRTGDFSILSESYIYMKR